MSYAQTKTQHYKKAKSKAEQNHVTTSDLETGCSNQVSTVHVYTWTVTTWVLKFQDFPDMIATLHLHYAMIISLLTCKRSLVTRF